MSAELVRYKHTSCPVLLCDVCRQPIRDAETGYVVWKVDVTDGKVDLDDIKEIRFIHQGRCDIDPSGFQMSMSLNEYLADFLHNTKYKTKRKEKSGRWIDNDT